MVRMPPDQVAALDKWRGRQSDEPGRPEAIRRLVEAMLQIHARAPAEKPVSKYGETGSAAKMITAAGLDRSPNKSSELAGKAIDRLGDKSVPVQEQARRKRRLIK